MDFNWNLHFSPFTYGPRNKGCTEDTKKYIEDIFIFFKELLLWIYLKTYFGKNFISGFTLSGFILFIN